MIFMLNRLTELAENYHNIYYFDIQPLCIISNNYPGLAVHTHLSNHIIIDLS